MTAVRESFNPVPLGVNGAYVVKGNAIGGFLAATAGTVTITSTDASGLNAVTLVNAVPLTAGVYLPIPLSFPAGQGGTVTLAGGASGTLMV